MKCSWITMLIGAVVSFDAAAESVLQNDLFSVTTGEAHFLDILKNDALPADARILNVTFSPKRIPGLLYGFGVAKREMVFVAGDPNFESVNLTYQVSYISSGEIHKESARIFLTKESPVDITDDVMEATDDFYTVQQGETIVLAPLANDIFPEASVVTLSQIEPVSHGNVLQDGNLLQYTADTVLLGDFQIPYALTAESGESVSAVIHIRIEPKEPEVFPPFAIQDEVELTPGEEILVDVLANDRSVSGGELFISWIRDASPHLTATIVDDKILIESSETLSETQILQYRVSDGIAESDTTDIIVSVIDSNLPPIAVEDFVTLFNGDDLIISPLVNDSDPEGDPIHIDKLMEVVGGHGAIDGDKIVFTPANDEFKNGHIIYQLADENGNVAQGKIHITADDQESIIAVADHYETIINRTIKLNPMENDVQEIGDASVVSVENPMHGSTKLIGEQIHYTADSEFIGIDSFHYVIENTLGQQSQAKIEVIIRDNNIPVAGTDFRNAVVDESVVIRVLENDSDMDFDALEIATLEGANGHWTLTGEDQKEVLFQPELGFIGIAKAQYVIVDPSGAQVDGEIHVRVHPVTPFIRQIRYPEVDPDLTPSIVKVLTQNELGTFHALTALPDMNHDGKQELVVHLNEPVPWMDGIMDMAILLDGDGLDSAPHLEQIGDDSLGRAQHYLFKHNTLRDDQSTLVGDFNHDGLMDKIFLQEFGIYLSLNSLSAVSELGEGQIIVSKDAFISSLDSSTPHVQNARVLDFNHDGIDDLAIAMAGIGDNSSAKVRILFGPLSASDKNMFNDESDVQFIDIYGLDSHANLAEKITLEIGDLNGDGVEDLVIGQVDSNLPVAKNRGIVNIVWGAENAVQDDLDLSLVEENDEMDRYAAVVFSSAAEQTIGSSVKCGDMNSDGIDDLILSRSVYRAPFPEKTINEVTVIHGRSDWLKINPVEENLHQKGQSYSVRLERISGTSVRRELFQSLTIADVNDDGFGELILTTPSSLLIVKGNDSIKPSIWDIGGLFDEHDNVIKIHYNGLIPEVTPLDVNGDGFIDLAITDHYREADSLGILYGGLHFR